MHSSIAKAKELEAKLTRSRERLRLLFDEVPCYISVQGPDLVILNANRRFQETFGPAIGKHCYGVYKHREEQCLVCPAMKAFSDGETHEHEEVVSSSDGRKIHVLCSTSPIRGKDGKVEAVIEMSTDITQIRRLQSQLESIGLLVGSISHGIKGLLTGLDGGIYLVNTGFEKGSTERVKRGWDMVQRNVGRIRSMVLDILYYAKDRELDVEDIDVKELVDDIYEIMYKKATDLDIPLELGMSDDLGSFEGDVGAIRAMLVNLLENSIEACRTDRLKPVHKVSFKVERSHPWMVFTMEDNGIGMDKETRAKLFTLFFSSKGSKGTGLGLFIAKKIVDKHGGTMLVESEPGVGSRFQVKLPLAARPSTEIDQEPGPFAV